MKKGFFSVVAVMAFVLAAGNAFAEEGSKEVQTGITDAYIPGGFNTASDAFVVVNGIFPNGCYRWSRAEVTNKGTLNHEVRTFAKVEPGLCLMVLIPYNKEVRLGQLEPGNHKVRFVNGDGTYIEKQMVVE